MLGLTLSLIAGIILAYVTGRCCRSFETSVDVLRCAFRGHQVCPAKRIQMIGEADNPASIKNVAISKIAIYIKSYLSATHWSNILISGNTHKTVDEAESPYFVAELSERRCR